MDSRSSSLGNARLARLRSDDVLLPGWLCRNAHWHGKKEAAGIAEKRSGARGPENVWGSALTGTICALAAYVLSFSESAEVQAFVPLLLLGYVASVSTKLSDTSASEVGKAYGKHTFLITTLKPVPPGTEGAVSLEGTLAGVVASVRSP